MKQFFSRPQIVLASPVECTGCGTCASICPQKCIRMKEDQEGFLQPKINTKECIHCHKCEKLCPVLNLEGISDEGVTKAFAAINKDSGIRERSSSGGVFYALAKWTIERGGVVFGARFDEQWRVVHDYTETLEGIFPFMGSKYVQSFIGNTYKKAKAFLEEGRYVLFSGTPCQLAGLRTYLREDYESLIQVDLICYGVPSPGVWRSFLRGVVDRFGEISRISFRDKEKGWKHYRCTIDTINAKKIPNGDLFFRGFLKEAYLRKSCHNCQFRTYHRNTDLTIADYWGVEVLNPELFDDKGISIVFCHSEKGKFVLENLSDDLQCFQQEKERAIAYNPCMDRKNPSGIDRIRFYHFYRWTSFRIAMSFIESKDSFVSFVYTRVKKKLHIV